MMTLKNMIKKVVKLDAENCGRQEKIDVEDSKGGKFNTFLFSSMTKKHESIEFEITHLQEQIYKLTNVENGISFEAMQDLAKKLKLEWSWGFYIIGDGWG